MKWIKRLYKQFITNECKRLNVKPINVHEKVINVKKGVRRYSLLVVYYPGIRSVCFNLGRHKYETVYSTVHEQFDKTVEVPDYECPFNEISKKREILKG